MTITESGRTADAGPDTNGPCCLLTTAKGTAPARHIRFLAGLRHHGTGRVTSLPIDAIQIPANGSIRTRFDSNRPPAFVGMFELNDRSTVAIPPHLPLTRPENARGELTHNALCRLLLAELGARGIPVNYDRRLCAFGSKATLERRCRAAEERTGISVTRPETWIRSPGYPEPDDLRAYRIAKPANGTRAQDIELYAPGQVVPARDAPVICQRLIPDPLLHEGRKIDCRVYAIIHTLPCFGYTLSRYVRIRHAATPYQQGDPAAEICSTSLSRRLGHTPRLSDLDQLSALTHHGAIRPALEYTVAQFMVVAADYAPSTPFLSIWGLDLALRLKDDRLTAPLIEVNPFPQLFTGITTADKRVDDILVKEFAAHISITHPQAMG